MYVETHRTSAVENAAFNRRRLVSALRRYRRADPVYSTRVLVIAHILLLHTFNCCMFHEGYSLHADLAVHKDDRKKLERLLRYGLRPPFAKNRLSLTPDGKVRLKLRKPYFTGQTQIVLEPLGALVLGPFGSLRACSAPCAASSPRFRRDG